MNFKTGLPVWTWPEWRKAPEGLRIRHNQTGHTGTYLRPSKARNNGAVVRWDDRGFGVHETNLVAPAREATPVRIKAWDLIGFDSSADTAYEELRGLIGTGMVRVRVAGGRALYEAVLYNDVSARSNNVKLARLQVGADGIREVSRYVGPDTALEVIAV